MKLHHYEKISEAIKILIMMYNIPQHTGIDLAPEFIKRVKMRK